MPGVKSLDELYATLRDAHFPATKDELIQAATAAGAPEDVIHALRAIPPEQYRNKEEVGRSVQIDPAAERFLTPGQLAEQSRLGGEPGLGQVERDVPLSPIEEADGEIPESRHPRHDRHQHGSF
jgi:hypothetical protein